METRGRPAAVVVVGWVFILVSGFMLLSGGSGLAALVLVERASRGALPEAFEGAPAMFFVQLAFVRHLGVLAALQVVAAVAVFAAAVGFMKLRAWARTFLEVFTWLSLLCLIAVGVVFVNSWIKMSAEMPPAMTAPLSPGTFALAGAVLWSAFVLAFVACAVFVLKALRGKDVREAVA